MKATTCNQCNRHLDTHPKLRMLKFTPSAQHTEPKNEVTMQPHQQVNLEVQTVMARFQLPNNDAKPSLPKKHWNGFPFSGLKLGLRCNPGLLYQNVRPCTITQTTAKSLTLHYWSKHQRTAPQLFCPHVSESLACRIISYVLKTSDDWGQCIGAANRTNASESCGPN